MSDEKIAVLERLRGVKPMDLVNHPLTFAIGIGLANGGLAAVRGKSVDFPTAAVLAAILGVGEAALEAFTPPEKRHHGLLAIAGYSVLGVAIGIAPFVRGSSETTSRGVPLAEGIRNPLDGNKVIA